ncbi:MAG: sugar phosphate isomerase/epimerase [Chloroflexi bacterium]|nr:sugar phosphate isomerase/epimerase [Chloroflexota bacterium]
MKIGFYTTLFQDRPLEQMLRLGADLGYQAVELPAFPGNQHVDVAAVLADGGASLKRLVSSYGLEISALNNARAGQLVLGPQDWTVDRWAQGVPSEERASWGAERVKDTVRAAALLGVPVVNGFVGSPVWDKWYNFPSTNEQAYERGWQLFAERWQPILDVCHEEGVKFAHEVHPTEIAYNVETAEKAVEVLGGRPEFGFNLDPSHLVWQLIDPVVFVKRLGRRIFHCHAKDVELQLDELPRSGVLVGGSWQRWDCGVRPRVPGWGDVNWRKLISALAVASYDYVLSFEHEYPVMSPEDGIAKAIDYLRPLIIHKRLEQSWW